ncbi:MAG: Rho-binding antiterminator [Kangiellaceae bacterium]|nr:Rho-binding antiterminator [Kangiellaceae bacterium]
MSKLISCDIHDYFEIACMRREKVQIESDELEEKLEGLAIDIVVKDRQEFIVLDSKDERLFINLNSIKSLTFCSSGETIQIAK